MRVAGVALFFMMRETIEKTVWVQGTKGKALNGL